MVFLCVCASVTIVYCGEMREPIEFIFGTYLPLDNSNPHSKEGPPPPLEGELWAPKFWVQWEDTDQI